MDILQDANQRILSAAAQLFSRGGYNGVSTREIASLACVNEVTIYRHFPNKRDLFLAAICKELSRVQLRGEQLRDIAEAADPYHAILRVFEVVEAALHDQPLAIPLILYGALEREIDVTSVLQRHLGEFVEILGHYLDPWIQMAPVDSDLPLSWNGRGLVVALISVASFRQSLERLFPAPLAGGHPVRALFQLCVKPGDPGVSEKGSGVPAHIGEP